MDRANLAKVTNSDGSSAITGARAGVLRITVQCWPVGEHLPSKVMPKLKEIEKQLPTGFLFRFAGEYKEQVSCFVDLIVVLGVYITAIYLALLAQFKHAVKPLIVFAAIPYGVTGAIIALAVMGSHSDLCRSWALSVSSASSSAKIIVVFEFTEERREEGEDLKLALIDAGILRLRPVLITVAATVIALFPLAAHGGPLWEPVCYVQIGGLTIATFITLGLVPILCSFVALDLKLVKWGKGKKETSHEQKSPHYGTSANSELATQHLKLRQACGNISKLSANWPLLHGWP